MVLEALVYKAYLALPSLPSGTRWNLVQTLLPQYHIDTLDKRTVQHLEMMFSNMFDSQVNKFENRYSRFLDSLTQLEVSLTD